MENRFETIVLEQLQLITGKLNEIDYKVNELNTKVSALEVRMDRLEERMDKLEARMDRLEARMDRLEERMDKLEERMDKLEERVEELEYSFEVLKTQVDENTQILKALEHSAQVNKANQDNFAMQLAKFEGKQNQIDEKVDKLIKDFYPLELMVGKNTQDIAVLKMAR